MFHRNRIAALAALIVWTAASQGAPLEAYGKLPTLTDVTISPDGASIAYVHELGAKRLVVTQDIATQQILGLVDVTAAKLRNLQWADNQTIVMTTSTTAKPMSLLGPRQEYYLGQTYNVQTKEQRGLFDHAGSIIGFSDEEMMNVVLGVPQPRIVNGRTMLFVRGVYFASNTGHVALFRIDLTNKTIRLVSKRHDAHGEDWIIDDAGNIVAEASYYANEQHWKVDVFQGGKTTQVLDVPAPIEEPSIEGFNEDGTALLVTLPDNDGTSVYKQVMLKDGSISPWVFTNADFGNLISSLRTSRVIGAERITEKNDYVFFDPQSDTMWRYVKATFKEATNIELSSWSDDRTKAVVKVFGANYGESYFFIDMTERKASPIGPTYTGVDDVSPEQWIEYHAADGRSLHAYLTLPIGREAKNLPLIVMPHGGPHSRDYPGFDWFAQALASRGYVVLQPQFRGSDGFGLELLRAGFGEFGKKMQTDLSDGVRALAAQGMIDPKRVCIVGASYGGYAALAGATLDTGVYRCAVSIAGLSDIRAQLRYWNWPRGSDDRNQRFWNRYLGVADYDDPKLNDVSPIKHVDKVTIPILLIHGEDDTVVPYDQSDDMADELKDAKKPYEFVTLKGEDHWLSKSETRLQMLEATVKFLETNNPPN